MHSQSITVDTAQSISLIAQKINRLSKFNKSKPLNLFKITKSSTQKAITDNYSEFTSLNLEESAVKQLLKTNDELIEVQLPSLYNSKQKITLQLYNSHLFSENLLKKLPASSKYLRGIVKGNPNSLVSLNITSGRVSAIISDNNYNVVIQESGLAELNYIMYNDQKLSKKNDFECHTNTAELDRESNSGLVSKSQKNNSADTISIYIVCDYAMYLQNATSSQSVIDYVTSLYNEVSSIYENEAIALVIDDIFVWTMQDPYNYTNAAVALSSFRDHLNGDFRADYAQFLSAKSANLGGVAFVNVDCSKSKSYSFANIDGSFNYVNSYSWDIHVCAHELGHNLGSPHTHDCVWGPNRNQSIDDCYGNGSTCNPMNNLSSAGTIMSYCHLSSGGVQFALGFGIEPGNLIRKTASDCANLVGFTCEYAEVLSISGTYRMTSMSFGSGAKHAPATNAYWLRYDALSDGNITIKSCNQSVDTRLYLYEGNCNLLSPIAHSDDDCNSGNGYYYSSELSNIPVIAGKTYFIEWDDRWSSQVFDFVFQITNDSSNSNNNPCTQGTLELNGVFTSSQNFQSTSQINMEAKVMNNSTMSLNSTVVQLNAGAEISQGSQFEINLEPCTNN